MFCTLIYLEYNRFKQYQSSHTTLRGSEESDCNKTVYFNPNCILQLILEYLLQLAYLDPQTDYDFVNEAGVCVGIKDYKPTVNGLSVFNPREMYYIVLLEKNVLGPDKLLPLLNPFSNEFSVVKRNSIKKGRSSHKDVKRRSSASRHSLANGSVSRLSLSKRRLSTKL